MIDLYEGTTYLHLAGSCSGLARRSRRKGRVARPEETLDGYTPRLTPFTRPEEVTARFAFLTKLYIDAREDGALLLSWLHPGVCSALMQRARMWQPTPLAERIGRWSDRAPRNAAPRSSPDYDQRGASRFFSLYNRHDGQNYPDGIVEWPRVDTSVCLKHRYAYASRAVLVPLFIAKQLKGLVAVPLPPPR